MKRLSFFLLFLFYKNALANDPQLRSVYLEKKSQISAGYENTELSTSEGTISGAGLRATYNHWFTPSYALEFGASIAMNNQGGVQSNSFTGFNLFGYYNLFGKPYAGVKKTYLSDTLISTEQQNSQHSLFVGAGVSQYFLNGNRGVYSASGLGAGAIYQFRFWQSTFRLATRWNQLQASQLKIDGLAFDVGISFSL